MQFQRSPAGAGTWTNQAASWNTTLQADGLYDLRVVTTDNAGNSFTSGSITVRVDNTAPTGSITAPANGAEIGVPPVALTSNSADAGLGCRHLVFERRPAAGRRLDVDAGELGHRERPERGRRRHYELRVNDDRQRRQLVHVRIRSPSSSTTRRRRPRRRVAPGSPSNAPITVTFTRERRHGLRRQRHLVLDRRRQRPAGQLRDRRRTGRPLERRLARGRSTSRPTTSATPRRRRRSRSSSTRPRRAAPPATRARSCAGSPT